MKNITSRVRDTKLFLSEAVEKLIDAKQEFQKAYDDNVLLTDDQLKEIGEILKEVNHWYCELETVDTKHRMVELRSFASGAVSSEELNKPVEN